MKQIKKVLIANRGEIALRVMRTAKEMNIRTVAVYSEADRNSPHVKFADEAVLLGPAPSASSYLLTDKIIEACKNLNVDAIHPGYGFLSENENFARKVTEAGIIFIGPSPESIQVMGSKLAAKQAVANYNVPLVPGTEEAITDVVEATKIAQSIGFPVLIKASAGGGGKGMRIVNHGEELEENMHRAISEAQSAFGDGSVFIEKYVTAPRHIEFQVLGDQQGNLVHLFERECSIQRRHQKVIEEAPSSVLTPELRAEMGEAAIKVAKSCNYFGAGTVEFIVDENLNYYFLEMNTRLQVEHPVTEMITGIDLVREQISIAEGKPLSFSQDDLKIHGHAVESRIYAEDPANNFLPDTGKLIRYQRPLGVGVRVDDGFEEGMDIPIYYDPMIAKMITHAATREQAIARMSRALDEYQISGIKTTIDFCKFVMQHEAFNSGNFDTKFIENYFNPAVLDPHFNKEEKQLIAALAVHYKEQQKKTAGKVSESHASGNNWKKRRSYNG